MTELRVMKNGSRVGKPWKLVEGTFTVLPLSGKEKWRTSFDHGYYDTKQQALDARAELDKRYAKRAEMHARLKARREAENNA